MNAPITVRGARLHNLQNLSLAIPAQQLVVLTGVSGSGKSTLAFDLLFKEGQRQYIEALGLAAFGLARPPVDAVAGLSPPISVDQHLVNRSPRSTVGTATDVFTYLRVLFARLGQRPCPDCGLDVGPGLEAADNVCNLELDDDSAGDEGETVACPHCGASLPRLRMAHFSFNKPEGACPTCTGLGTTRQVRVDGLVDEARSLEGGAVIGWDGRQRAYHLATLQAAGAHYGLGLDVAHPIRDLSPALRDLLLHGVDSPLFRRHVPGIAPPRLAREGRFEGLATGVLRRHAEHQAAHAGQAGYRDRLEALLIAGPCPDCAGTRLRAESRVVRVHGRSILELSSLSLRALDAWVVALPAGLGADARRVAAPVLFELHARLGRLIEVGAGYLSVERATPSLSAGEAQRLRLASLLGSALSGVLYVFDEPTIGLHHRDTRSLIEVLRRLRDLGNSVLVVEHDLQVIAAADHVIDFGPGAGKHGGRVVAAGTPTAIAAQPASLTGAYLSGRVRLPAPAQRRAPGDQALILRGAREHNLKDLDLRLPLGLLVAVTGVSGSGKSTLIFDVLERAVRQRLNGGGERPGAHDGLDGSQHLDGVVTIDQAHLARLPRSNAATYTETFGPIRDAFAATAEAQRRGLTARHFSFNVAGGRCERCQGSGVLSVAMQLLPDVEVRCPACRGRRFTRDTLAVRYRDHDIAQVLELTVDEALALFADVAAARARLQVLSEVGLGYLQLGQPATTLSGGEAQRIKLAKELGHRLSGRTLYLLDEPTTGLHLADTARLLGVLQRLVDAGHSVVVVEHNLELVKTADWVIDLGPEGGDAGGRLVAAGTPEQIAGVTGSFTGQGLRALLPPS